ncbi:hypothetical protein L6R52_42795 [Myxococcota bacterium]|nr:hypothetical protein [Myxococcota bacterium]
MKLPTLRRTALFTTAAALLTAAALVPTRGDAVPSTTPAADKQKPVLCSWFGADGNSKYTQCFRKSLSDATKECNENLKKKNQEGSCDCTDDEAFINGRCGS